MIALKPVELYEVSKSSMPVEFIKETAHSQEDTIHHGESARILAGPTPTFNPIVDNAAYDKKGPRILEQRLYAIRRELEQQLREHNRLLEMIRIQSTRLSAIEPLPGLFLSRIEELLYLIEPKPKDGIANEQVTTPDELDKRFHRGIAQLRLLLNRDHVLENRELLEELAQTKTSLQLKRDESFQLRVEQEQLHQRLTATAEKLEHFDAEIAVREDRITKLQKYVKESEAKHHKLFVDRRSMRNRSGTSVASFNFINDKRGAIKNAQQSWQIASIAVGLIFGCTLTLVSMWLAS